MRKGKEISWETYEKIQQDYYSDPFAEIKARNIKYKVTDEKRKSGRNEFKTDDRKYSKTNKKKTIIL